MFAVQKLQTKQANACRLRKAGECMQAEKSRRIHAHRLRKAGAYMHTGHKKTCTSAHSNTLLKPAYKKRLLTF